MELEAEAYNEEERRERGRLNTWVAITVALLVTFMGLTRVKNGNIVQAMLEAQSNKVDYFSWYQARNIRQDVAKAAAAQIQALSASQPRPQPVYKVASDRFAKIADAQNRKKQALEKQAKIFQEEYFRLAARKDQIDLAEAMLAIAVAVLAITALTQKRWLYAVAMVPAIFGIIMGLAGFFNWPIHPQVLIRFLGA